MFDMEEFYKVAMLRSEILLEAKDLELKWKRVVNSCRTEEHKTVAKRYTELLAKKLYRLGDLYDELCKGYY